MARQGYQQAASRAIRQTVSIDVIHSRCFEEIGIRAAEAGYARICRPARQRAGKVDLSLDLDHRRPDSRQPDCAGRDVHET